MTVKIDGNIPITRIAADLPGAIAVFESLGLDYSCAGDRSVADAAHAEGIPPEVVLASLRRLKLVDHTEPWADRPITELVRYVVAQHHRFVRDELARVAMLLADVSTSADTARPELTALRAAFSRLSELIIPHMHREEEEVFRAIEAQEKSWQANQQLDTSGRELSAAIGDLTVEHGRISAHLRTMRELRLELAAAEDLPARCSSILEDVARLEAHLHEYIFLENCVLFPRAAALEGQAATAES